MGLRNWPYVGKEERSLSPRSRLQTDSAGAQQVRNPDRTSHPPTIDIAANSRYSNVRMNERSAKARPSDLRCNIPCFKGELVAKLKKFALSDEALDDLLVDFSAAADRTRLRILFALLDAPELCVCDVAHVAGVPIATASHHLRKLRDTRVLRDRNDGRMVYYSLRRDSVRALLEAARASIAHSLNKRRVARG